MRVKGDTSADGPRKWAGSSKDYVYVMMEADWADISGTDTAVAECYGVSDVCISD